jgi:hypothetical protein
MPGAPISRIIDTISSYSIKKKPLQGTSNSSNPDSFCIQETNQDKATPSQNKIPNNA